MEHQSKVNKPKKCRLEGGLSLNQRISLFVSKFCLNLQAHFPFTKGDSHEGKGKVKCFVNMLSSCAELSFMMMSLQLKYAIPNMENFY